jgi:hypothetical protein
MARIGDSGAYELGNIKCVTCTENNKEAWTTNRLTKSVATSKIVNREIVKCPHCGKTGQAGGMKRWHFDNCKENGQPFTTVGR